MQEANSLLMIANVLQIAQPRELFASRAQSRSNEELKCEEIANIFREPSEQPRCKSYEMVQRIKNEEKQVVLRGPPVYLAAIKRRVQ